jgi:hypothetical protein
VAIYTSAKALSRWPINDESTLTLPYLNLECLRSSGTFQLLSPSEYLARFFREALTTVGTASRVPRVTLALACSEGLYTLFHPIASSLIHIQYQPEYYTYL